jgi:hypothetical protein
MCICVVAGVLGFRVGGTVFVGPPPARTQNLYFPDLSPTRANSKPILPLALSLRPSDIYLLNVINATTFSRYTLSIIELIRYLVLYIILILNLFAFFLFTLLSLVVALSKVLITYNFQTFT